MEACQQLLCYAITISGMHAAPAPRANSPPWLDPPSILGRMTPAAVAEQ
jgi:hypothetical protein